MQSAYWSARWNKNCVPSKASKNAIKAFESGANVTLEFDAGFDADQALTDVREKVDLAKPELPQNQTSPKSTKLTLRCSQFWL